MGPDEQTDLNSSRGIRILQHIPLLMVEKQILFAEGSTGGECISAPGELGDVFLSSPPFSFKVGKEQDTFPPHRLAL